jgi:hypothetical protein
MAIYDKMQGWPRHQSTYMKKSIAVILIGLFFVSFSFPTKEKWIKLFNGRDINDWTVKIFHHEVGDNY